MKIDSIAVGAFCANCYFLVAGDEAIIVDPGDEAKKICSIIDKLGAKVIAIVNTHGHVDHIGANMEVHDYTGADIYIHEDDAAMLGDASLNLSMFTGGTVKSREAHKQLRDGDEIRVGGETLKVLHTPGHTQGGICLLGDGFVLTGDTLFQASVGRSDFPGGSHTQLIDSIKTKLMVLADDIKVYPGHGPASTIGYERTRNPFL